MKSCFVADVALSLAMCAASGIATADSVLSPMKIMQINDCLFMVVVDESMVGAQVGSPKRMVGDRILSEFYSKGCHTITTEEWTEFKRAPDQYVASYRAEARNYQELFKAQRQAELAAKIPAAGAAGSD